MVLAYLSQIIPKQHLFVDAVFAQVKSFILLLEDTEDPVETELFQCLESVFHYVFLFNLHNFVLPDIHLSSVILNFLNISSVYI
jgi:hypothetical protein